MIKFEEGERIYLIKRRHPIVLRMKTSPFAFILSIITLLILLLLFFFSPSWPKGLIKLFPSIENYNLRYLLLFFLSISLLFFWNLLWFAILDYYLNCYLVTNQRIIQVEMKGLFNFAYSSIFYDKIQDMTVTIKGFLPAIFRFGDIQIQTAGELGRFVLQQISDPEIVKQVILEAQRDYLQRKLKP